STKESSSIELVNAADKYIDLKELLPLIRLE
ncbi:MAG TPA: NYN domain-containing protein, partial [Aquifex aeolicus]|nr:NYN domain-containing protein [Aquifex aeolicus]